MADRIYVGCKAGTREVFLSANEPTQESHGKRFAAVIGPFRTLRAAEFMRDNGAGNPHCQTVADAERIVRVNLGASSRPEHEGTVLS